MVCGSKVLDKINLSNQVFCRRRGDRQLLCRLQRAGRQCQEAVPQSKKQHQYNTDHGLTPSFPIRRISCSTVSAKPVSRSGRLTARCLPTCPHRRWEFKQVDGIFAEEDLLAVCKIKERSSTDKNTNIKKVLIFRWQKSSVSLRWTTSRP